MAPYHPDPTSLLPPRPNAFSLGHRRRPQRAADFKTRHFCSPCTCYQIRAPRSLRLSPQPRPRPSLLCVSLSYSLCRPLGETPKTAPPPLHNIRRKKAHSISLSRCLITTIATLPHSDLITTITTLHDRHLWAQINDAVRRQEPSFHTVLFPTAAPASSLIPATRCTAARAVPKSGPN